jgi:hypothetical protein
LVDEEIEEFEKKYGTITSWQKIIMISLIILAGIYEIQIGI